MRTRSRDRAIDTPIELGTSGLSQYDEVLTSYTSMFDPAYDVYSHRDVCVDELHAGPPYKTGGPLDVRHFKTDLYDDLPYVDYHSCKGCYFDYWLTGRLMPVFNPIKYLDWTDPSSPSLDDWSWCNPDHYDDGVNGWGKAKPAQPEASLGVAFGEAREIPHMLAQTAKAFARSYKTFIKNTSKMGIRDAADDWLNLNFGWLPFLRDIEDFIKVVKYQEDLLRQLRKDNNQWIYRRRSIRREETVEQVFSDSRVAAFTPVGASNLYNTPNGNTRIERVTRLNSWFVGRFKYYIPYLKTSGPGTTREMVHLLGLRPTPMVLYELMPWSWLVDWFTNVGTSFSNLQSCLLDGVVSKYAYVMSHKTQRVTGEYFSNFKQGPIKAVRYAQIEQKIRSEASPFGFENSADSFSQRQWSILAALGFTRNSVRRYTR